MLRRPWVGCPSWRHIVFSHTKLALLRRTTYTHCIAMHGLHSIFAKGSRTTMHSNTDVTSLLAEVEQTAKPTRGSASISKRRRPKFAGLDGMPLAFSAKEVAAMLGRHIDTVYLAIENGEIPTKRVGRVHCIPRWWVEQWLTKPSEAAS